MTASLQDRRIEIGGQTYTIRVSIKFFLALQEKWDLPDDAAVRAAIPDKAKNMRGMVDVVWAGLQSHHPDLSWDQTLALLDGADMGAVAEALATGMEAAAPPTKDRPPEGQGQTQTP